MKILQENLEKRLLQSDKNRLDYVFEEMRELIKSTGRDSEEVKMVKMS